MLKFIAFAFMILAAATATEVSRCKGNKPFPLAVRVKGCDKEPCNVVKGTNAEMEVHFSLTNDTTNLHAEVMATALGITGPYELPDEVRNVCGNLMFGAYCPVYATEDITYDFKLPILKIYPAIKVKVELSIVDDHGNTVACFNCAVQVKKG